MIDRCAAAKQLWIEPTGDQLAIRRNRLVPQSPKAGRAHGPCPGSGGNLMATDPNTPRSRRAILAAAAGSAAAVAASTVLPASVAALAAPMLTETNNASGAETSLTFTDPTPLTGTEVAFKVVNSGPGAAVEAINSNVGGATGGR